MQKVIAGLAAGSVVILVALVVTTYQSQKVDLLDTSLAAAPVTKLTTVNGKSVLSSSLWQEVHNINVRPLVE